MSRTVMLALRADDAEPVLWQAAKDAAYYGALVDFIDRRAVNSPWHMESGESLEYRRKAWQQRFLRAKRTVESFGVDYEQTTEAETLGTYIPHKTLKSHLVEVGGLTFRQIDKSVPDHKNARPRYLGEPHRKACNAAADRVVARWVALLKEKAIA